MKDNNQRPGMREFNMAWEEYFKDKPKPKNDDEEKKQLEEFHHWYNYVRKQSDTGKTPAEMYNFWMNDEKLINRPFSCESTKKMFKEFMDKRKEEIGGKN